MGTVGGDLGGRQVKADGAVALAELDRQRQADVAQADDRDGGRIGDARCPRCVGQLFFIRMPIELCQHWSRSIDRTGRTRLPHARAGIAVEHLQVQLPPVQDPGIAEKAYR